MNCRQSSSRPAQTCQRTWGAPRHSRSVRSPRQREHQVAAVLLAGALRLNVLLLDAPSGQPLDLASRIRLCSRRSKS